MIVFITCKSKNFTIIAYFQIVEYEATVSTCITRPMSDPIICNYGNFKTIINELQVYAKKLSMSKIFALKSTSTVKSSQKRYAYALSVIGILPACRCVKSFRSSPLT